MATKVKCECGLYLNEDNMNKHLTSKTHNDLIKRKYRKLNNYNAMKDSYNCCSNCLKTNIDDLYFVKDRQICSCCDEISRGGERRCKDCQQLVDINKMERPYLIRCKACAKKRLSKKVNCKICGVEVQLYNMARHLHKKHNEEKALQIEILNK